MDRRNNLSSTSRPLTNSPVYCPWTSKAPFTSSVSLKGNPNVLNVQTENCTAFRNQSTSHVNANNCQQVNNKYVSIPGQETPIQQSSSQFFHFLRLMQLFPDVHPATLHTVMTLCQNNFFAAVDKLLYAKKCKELYNSRKSLFQQLDGNRYQPYGCNFGITNSHSSIKSQNMIINCNFKQSQSLPSGNVNNGGLTNANGIEKILLPKVIETKKIIIRNRITNEKVQSPTTENTTFPPCHDLNTGIFSTCKIPINPTRSATPLPEDLSLSNSNDISSKTITSNV